MIPWILLFIFIGAAVIVLTTFIIKSFLNPQKMSSIADSLKDGKSPQAIKLAKQMLVKEPRNAELHYLLGMAYLKENKAELALMEFKTVNSIAIFGGYCPEVAFRKQIADLYFKFGQHEEALKERLLLIRLEPHIADHYYEAGFLFEERNQSEKSENYYRKALEVNSGHGYSHLRLGLLLYKNKKNLEAKVELETAMKLMPNEYEAYYYYGKVLKENHDYVGALLALERAQKSPDLKIKALVERGACYMSMNNFDNAVSELERAVKLAQDESATEVLYARYFAAFSYEKTRNIDKALEHWEKIYAKKPAFKDVAEKLSQYQELRTDDYIKDYMVSNQEYFLDLCKKMTVTLGLSVQDQTDIPNGCQIIAIESSTKWRNAKKLPKLLWFLRAPEIIDDSTLRNMYETMKGANITRGTLIISSGFTRRALEFSESRPIELVNKDRLIEILKKTT